MTKNVKKIMRFLYCLVFCTIVAVGVPQMVRAEETFEGKSGTSGNLLWEITADGHLTITGVGDYNKPYNIIYSNIICYAPEWSLYSKYIYTAKIDVANITSTSAMFYGCQNLTSIDLRSLDTSKVTDMKCMFCGCSSLTSIDVSYFDTKNVTNMELMFYHCENLESLDLSNFNTSNVTSMQCMFDYSNLKSLDISNFDTINVSKSNRFYLAELSTLEKLYFFENSQYEYELPLLVYSFPPLHYWINEDNETCTKTAMLDRKMIYTRVDKDYVPPVVTPTPIPTNTPEPSITPSVVPSVVPEPSASPVVSSDVHIFNDYNYSSLVTGSAVVIYGNGILKTIDGKKVNNKVFTAYTDILASYKYTVNSKGIVKPSVGKVIVGVTKSDTKPEVNSKNKIIDTSASKIAKAKIKNGQITVTAVGKEGGLVYLWVIDTGNKGVSACCPINVKLAPTKLEVQNTSGSKIANNTKLENGKTLDVCVTGLVSSTKTEDGTYIAEVASKYKDYVSVVPVEGSTNKFTITAKGIKNNKDTKVTVTFKCDQNGKKTNLSLTITK